MNPVSDQLFEQLERLLGIPPEIADRCISLRLSCDFRRIPSIELTLEVPLTSDPTSQIQEVRLFQILPLTEDAHGS